MFTAMNNELILILLFGLIMLLLIGISYNTLIATSSSTEESKKIPLYYISTRDPGSYILSSDRTSIW